MCGINGCGWSDAKLVEQMNEALRHRGPDDAGVETADGVTLGHVRLSIIDLSAAGHQPMSYSKAGGASSARHRKKGMRNAHLSIVYNGEIYNYQDLKEELVAKGYDFSTKTDTEVILAAYRAWGPRCVERFNGMWAFCIYDRKKGVLFCSRDRLGQKPLYYALTEQGFLFSSELKGLLEHEAFRKRAPEDIDAEALELYFSLGYIPAPFTIYKDVRKLEAAHNLVFDLKRKRIGKKLYWNLPGYRPVKDRKRLIEEGRALLKDATRLRMIADVPVGAFLSGGLDSSATVGEMREFTDISRLHTFSIGFDGKYDESEYVRIVKDHFRTRHHHQYFRRKDFEGLIDRYAEVYDEPFGDFSGFPTYAVSELARAHVTVCLSGDGGDEVFGGYANHLIGRKMDVLRKVPRPLRWLGSKLPARRNLDSLSSFYLYREACRVSLEPPERFYAEALKNDGLKTAAYDVWMTRKLQQELKRGGGSLAEATRTHDLLHNTLSDNFLVKVDRASMAHALEVRSPFLDYRLVEWAQTVPTRWKAGLFRTKVLLRDIITGLVPDSIVKRGKQGFTPPLEEWILDKRYLPDIDHALEALEKVDASLAGVFEDRILKENGKLALQYRIRLFLFGRWWRRWMLPS